MFCKITMTLHILKNDTSCESTLLTPSKTEVNQFMTTLGSTQCFSVFFAMSILLIQRQWR